MGQPPVPKPLHHDDRRTLKDILQLQVNTHCNEEEQADILPLSFPSSGNQSGEKMKKKFIKFRKRGLSLASTGAVDKAMDNYRAALSLLADLESSASAQANNEDKGLVQNMTQSMHAEMGDLLFEHGRDGALEYYKKALKNREGERTIDVVSIYFSMGRIYRDNGGLDQSLACFHRCLDAHAVLLESRDHAHLIPVLYYLGCLHLLRGEIVDKNAKHSHDDCSTIFSSVSVNTCASQVQYEYHLALRFFREALALQEDVLYFMHLGTLHYLGSLCARLNMSDEALEYFTKELNIIRNDPKQKEKVVEVLRAVAALMYGKKQFVNAIQVLEEASVILRSFLGNDDVDLARNLARTGHIYHKNNDHENAVACVKEAVRIMRVNCRSQEYTFAKLCRRLGNIYASINDYDNAVKNYEEALNIQQQTLGKEHIENFHTLRRLGNAHFLQNKFQLALSCYVEGLRIWRQDTNHNRSKLAPVMRNMGFIFFTQKKYDFSLRCYLDALKSYETDENLNGRSDEICELYNNVGNVYLTINDFDEAVKYYESALSMKSSLLGNNHIDTTGTICNLGQAHVGLGNLDKALELYNQALSIREKHGKNHKDVGQVCNEIGNIYIKLKRYGDAQIFLQRSLRGKRQSASNDPSHIENELITLSNLGHLFFKKEQYSKALEMYESVLSKAYTTESLLRASTLHSMGNVSMKTGELDSALRYFFRSLAMKKKILGYNHKSVLRTLHNIGIVYREMGDFGKAEDYFEESVLMSNRVNCDPLEIARVMTDAGRVYLATNQFLQAKTTFDYIGSTLNALPFREDSDNLEHLKKTVRKLEKAASAGLQVLSSAKNSSSANSSQVEAEEC